MSRIITIFILLSFFCNSFAQWQQLNGPYGMHTGCMAVQGSVFYAASAGQQGEIYRSTDYGSHWSEISDGLPQSTDFADLATFGPYVFVICGGDIYRAGPPDFHWDLSNNGLPESTLAGTIFSQDSLLLIGTNNGVFRSTNGGNDWFSASQGIYFNPVLEIAEHLGIFYASTLSGIIYSSHDTCNTWQEYETGTLPDEPLRAMCFQDSVFFVGTMYGLYRTTDNGYTWEECDLGVPYPWISCTALDSSYLYACTYGDGIFRSQDYGVSWEPTGYNLLVGSVQDLIPVEGYLLTGSIGGVFKSWDYGDTWTSSNEGLCHISILSMDFDGTFFFTSTGIGLFRSSDGCETWDLVLPATYMVRRVFCKDSFLFATPRGTSPYGSGIVRSADAGNTWEPVNTGLESDEISCLAAKGPFLFAGTGEGLYRSNDNGNYWSKLFSGETVYDIACTEEYVFAGCYGATYRSSNNGNDWTLENGGLTNYAFYTMHADDSLVYGASVSIHRSKTSPVQWEEVSNGISQPAHINDMTGEGPLLYAGDMKGVLVSSNYGDEWFMFDEGFTEEYVYVHALLKIDSLIYAGTARGLWKRPESELFVVQTSEDTVGLSFEQSSESGLIIHANTGWSLDGTFPAWLTADVLVGTGSDTITFTALNTNQSNTQRFASFQLVSSSAPAVSVTVLQEAFQGYLEIRTDSLVLSYQSESVDTLFIAANTAWNIEGTMPAWLSADAMSGNGTDTVVFLSAEANVSEQPRTVEFVITAFQANPVNLMVTQKGNPIAIDEAEAGKIKIYPNPSNGSFSVESRIPISRISVYSIDGILIETRDELPGMFKENFDINRKGILLVEIRTSVRVFVFKVVCY